MATFYARTVTCIDLIKRAYRLIGVYSIGETPSADESTDGLTALNAMLGDWANEGLMVYANTTDTVPLTAGVSAYTIGASGGVVANRPQEVLSASYIQYGTVSFPLVLLTQAQYNDIQVKTTGGIPTSLFYSADFPNGTITLFPVPQDTMTLNLVSKKQLTVFQYITDIVSMPPGYENAIVFNLAKYLSAEFGMPLPPQVERQAAGSKRTLKRTNNSVPILQIPYGIPMKRNFARTGYP
jgi:hypothetical protein